MDIRFITSVGAFNGNPSIIFCKILFYIFESNLENQEGT